MDIEHKVFTYLIDDEAPDHCLCGCGAYDRLFTEEAQLKNKYKKKVYRQFANQIHLKAYLKKLKLIFYLF